MHGSSGSRQCKVDATYHFVDTRVTKKITPPSEFKIYATFGDDERDVKRLAATLVKRAESAQGDLRSSSTEACRPFEGMGEL